MKCQHKKTELLDLPNVKKYIAQRKWRKLCLLIKLSTSLSNYIQHGYVLSHFSFQDLSFHNFIVRRLEIACRRCECIKFICSQSRQTYVTLKKKYFIILPDEIILAQHSLSKFDADMIGLL
jgi:hypothetical protein